MKKKFRKSVALAVSAIMAFSALPSVLADEEVVYTYNDEERSV